MTLDPLRLDERELLDLMGHMKVAVFRAAADSSLLAVNPAGAELLGARSPAELVGRRFEEFYEEPADRALVRQLLERDGTVSGFRFRARRLDGSVVWMETNLRARRAEDGTLLLEGFGRQLEELVAAEEEIRRLSQFLGVVIDSANVWLVVLDAQTRVLIWNRAAEAISGYSRAEVIGSSSTWEALFPDPEHRERVAATVRGVIGGAEVRGEETPIRARDGAERLVSWHARGLRDEHGRPIGVVALGRDITVERALLRKLQAQESEQRAELERQVRARTEELERANRDLQQLDRMKDRFLANISHELRTPLVSGLGYVDLILDGGLGAISPKVRRGLRISRQNLQRLAAQIDDLLAFTQHGPRAARLTLVDFALGELVEEALLDLRAQLRPGARVTVELEPSLPIRADREQIRRVLVNLLVNADKFSGEEPEIEVRARRLDARHAEVRVLDRGIGIPEEERDAVFERLYRSSRTDPSVYHGTGLGLHLVRETLQGHGCTVRAEGREPGAGTAIIFTLPLAPP